MTGTAPSEPFCLSRPSNYRSFRAILPIQASKTIAQSLFANPGLTIITLSEPVCQYNGGQMKFYDFKYQNIIKHKVPFDHHSTRPSVSLLLSQFANPGLQIIAPSEPECQIQAFK